jgi:hypothetical protein
VKHTTTSASPCCTHRTIPGCSSPPFRTADDGVARGQEARGHHWLSCAPLRVRASLGEPSHPSLAKAAAGARPASAALLMTVNAHGPASSEHVRPCHMHWWARMGPLVPHGPPSPPAPPLAGRPSQPHHLCFLAPEVEDRSCSLSFSMIDGPNCAAGPTHQFLMWLIWVHHRVDLAFKLGFGLFYLLNYRLVLIFENSYLMLGSSKNSKCGLFGNLEKRFMQ